MDIFGVVTDLFRGFAFFIDNVVYSLIPIVYKLFIYLSEINLFSMDDDTPIGALIGRIYVFLGIFMLFKVTFSLIQYLIDPNSFTDKSKGFGKLVTNAMVTILLLVSVPYIFNFAMKLQNTIVTSNIIGTLIMGNNSGNIVQDYETDENGIMTSAKLDVDTVNEMATDVQFLMYGAFFSINPTAQIGELDEGKNKCANTPIFGTVAMAQTEGCLETLKAEFDSENNEMAKNNVFLPDFFKTADTNGINTERKFSGFGSLLSWRDANGEYVINYLPFISALAGIYVVFLLVSFCVDIAVRAIKLCFLQMVAPIAIVSYIDPKESISNGKLHNWIKESLTTYFSLFLRLATLFLVMLLISVIASSVLAQDGFVSKQIDNEYNIWIYLFLLIGAFMFAKKVPQMIENIFGIKASGELSLNPFKGAGGAVLAGGAAFAGAGMANALAVGSQGANIVKQTLGAEKGQRYDAFRRNIAGVSKEKWNDMSASQKRMSTFSGTRHGIGGVFGIVGGAGSAAARVAAKGETKGFSDTRQRATSAMEDAKKARIERDSRQAQSFGTRASSAVTSFAGIKNQYGGYGVLDKKAKDLREKIQEADEYQRKAAARKIETVHDIADSKGWSDDKILKIDTSSYLEQAKSEETIKSLENTDGYETALANAAYQAYLKDVATELDVPESKLTDKDIISAVQFKTLSEENSNSDSIREYEASLKKELKSIEESMGSKEKKDNK